jgi:DNA-binding IclR family transcriptional regulator
MVDIVDGPLSPRVDLWVGLQDGAHATAFGKQILAVLDPAARRDYITRHPLHELTPYTVSSPREFLHRLEARPAVSVDDQEYALGFTCLAVPVASSSWLGALAISFPSGRARENSARENSAREHSAREHSARENSAGYAKVLQAGAAQLSMVLGIHPGPSQGQPFHVLK